MRRDAIRERDASDLRAAARMRATPRERALLWGVPTLIVGLLLAVTLYAGIDLLAVFMGLIASATWWRSMSDQILLKPGGVS